VHGEVLVDRLRLGAVMPVVEAGVATSARSPRNSQRTLAWMKVAWAATMKT
jgi:hypothetical protein